MLRVSLDGYLIFIFSILKGLCSTQAQSSHQGVLHTSAEVLDYSLRTELLNIPDVWDSNHRPLGNESAALSIKFLGSVITKTLYIVSFPISWLTSALNHIVEPNSSHCIAKNLRCWSIVCFCSIVTISFCVSIRWGATRFLLTGLVNILPPEASGWFLAYGVFQLSKSVVHLAIFLKLFFFNISYLTYLLLPIISDIRNWKYFHCI